MRIGKENCLFLEECPVYTIIGRSCIGIDRSYSQYSHNVYTIQCTILQKCFIFCWG